MFTIVVASNDDAVLQGNLLSSEITANEQTELLVQQKFDSAALAYNDGLMRARSDLVLFVHQDVYIPTSWQETFRQAIKNLQGRPWGVLGIIGKSRENRVIGRTWSTGIGKEIGCRILTPELAESLDELLIVVNKKTGICFDERLPGFHLYGTDIVQTAKRSGWETYVINAPVIHNSLPVKKLGSDFSLAYRYMQRKWHRKLPIPTLTASITQYGWPLTKITLKQLFKKDNRSIYQRLDNPRNKAQELGYEK